MVGEKEAGREWRERRYSERGREEAAELSKPLYFIQGRNAKQQRRMLEHLVPPFKAVRNVLSTCGHCMHGESVVEIEGKWQI